MLEKTLPLFRKRGLLNPLMALAQSGGKILKRMKPRQVRERLKNEEKYKARERRVLDAIFMKHEPDRVPAIGNGVNFFPAKYAGMTCAEYMYDFKKMKIAMRKMDDFDLDMHFNYNILAFGKLADRTGQNLLKLPGHHIDKDSGYQYNEINRLKAEEYERFVSEGMQFLVEEIAPRCGTVFAKKGVDRLKTETLVMLETMKFGAFLLQSSALMQAMGHYNIFGTFGMPPFDIMSFVFRDIHNLSRDMMKRQYREKIREICERMNKWLFALYTTLPKVTGQPGVWFVIERAFSLSPRQFEQFYWPTLKKLIIGMVEEGLIPFLTMESDVTHLVHFLREIPPRIARRCVFNCDTTDIFEANRILDGHMCIAGNIPLSTMCVGTPNDVEKYCERLFAELKPGGGFLLSPALGIPDEGRPENVQAYIKYAQKYGKYT